MPLSLASADGPSREPPIHVPGYSDNLVVLTPPSACLMKHQSVSTSAGGLPAHIQNISPVSCVRLWARGGLLSFGGYTARCLQRLFQHLSLFAFSPWQGQTFQAHYFMNQRLEPEREGPERLTRPGAAWALPPACSLPGTHRPPPSGRKGLLLLSDLPVGHSTSGLPEAPGQGLILESQSHRRMLMPSEVTVFV